MYSSKTRLTIPAVLYGCETLSLTLTKEHRQRLSENRVLRRIFGPKRDDVTGELRSCTVKIFISLLLAKYHYADKIKEN
jgi:hypothetical protein